MTLNAKLLLRQAVAIHERLKVEHSASANVQLPEATWRDGELVLRQIHRARRRGWLLAAGRLKRDLQDILRRLQGELAAIDCALCPRQGSSRQASVADIRADLVALHAEFEDVSFDRKKRTISVTTESIELEGVYLGPFEIRLRWSDLADGHPQNYRVIALDANPAASNENVTHPHVQDEGVCEGDGRRPIRNALEQGRLLDFFTIVANLLRTYNSGSPFVSLADWHGVECADCGTTVHDDQRMNCEKCGSTLCDQCYINCPSCTGIFCGECVTRCGGCDESHCDGCMKHCSHCLDDYCPGCLDDKERCSDCHDQATEKRSAEPAGDGEPGEPYDAVAPVHANRVGQAAVPA